MIKFGLVATALVLGTSLTAHAQDTTTLRMQSLMPAGSSANAQFEAFAEQVAAMSGGRLVIEVLPVDSVVQSDETLEAVGQGILDGHFGSPGYFAGQDPAFGVLGAFVAGYETPEQFQMFYDLGGGVELARELYADYNVYFVGSAFWQPEAIPSRVPLRSVEDFNGVKIRAPGGTTGQVFAKLGASVVNLPGSEIFQALSSGVIDATDYSTLGQNAQTGLYDIAKYTIYPSITSMPSTDISINADKWEALPEDLRAIVEGATREFSANLSAVTFMDDQDAYRQIQEDGVEIINWEPEERRKLREVASEVVAEYAKGSETAQKVYDAHITFMKKINLL